MPVEPTSERMRRILVMVPWVLARGEPSVQEVCERFGITRAELAADIDLLMVCGLQPFMPGDYIEAFIEGDRVIISAPLALDRPPRLARLEALQLLVAGRAMTGLAGLDEEEAASLRSALEKLARALSPGDHEVVAGLADRIAVHLGGPGEHLLPALRDAIERRERLAITYFSAGRAETGAREVDPLLVLRDRGAFYLIARDVGSDEERTFRVDRIRDAAPTGATFEPPPSFDPGRYAEGLPIEPSPDDTLVVIEVSRAAAWMREVIPCERVVDAPDGGARLEIRTARTGWLVPLLLSAGPDARALEPASFVDEVRDAARAALARYAS